MIQDFNYGFNLGIRTNSLKQLKQVCIEQAKEEMAHLNEQDESPKIPKNMPPKEMEEKFLEMMNRIKYMQPLQIPVPLDESCDISEKLSQDEPVNNTAAGDGILTKSAIHLSQLLMTTYTLSELTALGLTEEDIDKYFAKLYSMNSDRVLYLLGTDELGGRKVNTIEEAADAIADVKIEQLVTRLYKEYKEGNLNFSDLKEELEKAGANDVQYCPLPYGRVKVIFTINGKQSYIPNNKPDFDCVTEIIQDDDGRISYHVTAEGVDASLDDYPEEGTYATKDYLKILYGFDDDIIAKYFTPTVIHKNACGVRYVLNDDIEIYGHQVKNIRGLYISLKLLANNP